MLIKVEKLESQITLKFLGARKQKGLNRIQIKIYTHTHHLS